MSSAYLPNKRNLVNAESERWRPPVFEPPVTARARFTASLRRFFDLQAGSAWRDLTVLLGQSAGTLLDVGCGAQPFRPLIPHNVRYIGIDTVEAEEHFGYKIPDTIYFDGTIWPVEDESADTILCTETLEHVLDPTILLREAHRSLKPGGRLIVTVPFSARWHFIPFDYWRYTPSSLNHLFTECGFRDTAVYSRGDHVTVAAYKAMALFTPLLFPQGKSGLQSIVMRLIGLIFVPLFILLALIGNLSLAAAGADDCLGYTAVTIRNDQHD